MPKQKVYNVALIYLRSVFPLNPSCPKTGGWWSGPFQPPMNAPVITPCISSGRRQTSGFPRAFVARLWWTVTFTGNHGHVEQLIKMKWVQRLGTTSSEHHLPPIMLLMMLLLQLVSYQWYSDAVPRSITGLIYNKPNSASYMYSRPAAADRKKHLRLNDVQHFRCLISNVLVQQINDKNKRG